MPAAGLKGSEAATGRILVVDDSEMNRDMLSRRLRRSGYDVQTEEGGKGALERIGEEDFDLVILDVMMPDMDGITVLRSIRERFTPIQLPVLMATAKDSSEDVVTALESGANDYVTKPLDFPVVMARVRTQLALKRSHDELQSAHRRMKADLDAAARIQQALIPEKPQLCAGATAAWVFRPCTEVGGDIFDVVPLDDGHIGMYLVDVSGHGVPAALLSVTVSRLLSHSATESVLRSGAPLAAPRDVVNALNRRFQMDGTGQYFTFLYASLDVAARRLTFVSAGHPGPLHVRKNGECRHLRQESFAVGWFPQMDLQEQTVELESGDRVYFLSDGVIEEPNAEGDMFEMQRVIRLLQSASDLPLRVTLDELLLELQNWNGGAPFADDVSILALEMQ